jgi:hypothetical protein
VRLDHNSFVRFDRKIDGKCTQSCVRLRSLTASFGATSVCGKKKLPFAGYFRRRGASVILARRYGGPAEAFGEGGQL